MDLYSRAIVGWHLSDDFSTAGVVNSIENSNRTNVLHTPVVIHNDRGVQYISKAYLEATLAAKFIYSYSRKGNPWVML